MLVSIWWVVGALVLGMVGGMLFKPERMSAREERIHYGINEPPAPKAPLEEIWAALNVEAAAASPEALEVASVAEQALSTPIDIGKDWKPSEGYKPAKTPRARDKMGRFMSRSKRHAAAKERGRRA